APLPRRSRSPRSKRLSSRRRPHRRRRRPTTRRAPDAGGAGVGVFRGVGASETYWAGGRALAEGELTSREGKNGVGLHSRPSCKLKQLPFDGGSTTSASEPPLPSVGGRPDATARIDPASPRRC